MSNTTKLPSITTTTVVISRGMATNLMLNVWMSCLFLFQLLWSLCSVTIATVAWESEKIDYYHVLGYGVVLVLLCRAFVLKATIFDQFLWIEHLEYDHKLLTRLAFVDNGFLIARGIYYLIIDLSLRGTVLLLLLLVHWMWSWYTVVVKRFFSLARGDFLSGYRMVSG